IAYNRALLETISGSGAVGSIIRGTARGADRRGGRDTRMVRPERGRRRRCDHAALARWGGDALRASVGFSTRLRARHGIIRRRNTGRAVRTHARAWRAAWLVPRTSLPVGIP